MLITFDIGGTSIKYGILTLRKGQPVFVMQEEVSSDARVLKGPGILHRVESLIAKAMRQDIKGIAISTAGMVDAEKGCIQYANDNIPEYTGLQFKQQLEGERCECRCFGRSSLRCRKGCCSCTDADNRNRDRRSCGNRSYHLPWL